MTRMSKTRHTRTDDRRIHLDHVLSSISLLETARDRETYIHRPWHTLCSVIGFGHE